MMDANLKSKVVKGVFWTLLEKFSVQIVGFVVGMVLARLLTPTDYGTVALTGIFFAIANVLVDSGFGIALIHKKNADDLDFNSVFYLNLCMSILAYVVLFLAAPWIARFYKTPELTAIVRVSAICFLFNAVNAIQGAELTKKMLFHLSFRISLITCLTSAVCGITFAFLGFGVWALVWSSLITGFVGVIARWFIVAWRPRLIFSYARLKPLFAYGWKMSLSSLLDQFFVHLDGLLIGKFYTKADLAYVNKGQHTPALLMNQIDGALGRVSFPAFVQFQDDPERLRQALRKMIQLATFWIFPLMVGVAACSYSCLRLLYGNQWTAATPFMMLACFSFALRPFNTMNLRGIMALGRSDIFLRLEIVKKVLRIIVIVIALPYGIFPFMLAVAFVLGPISIVINSWPNRKLLNYTLFMQLCDVMPTALVCVAEAVVVFGIDVAGNTVKPIWGIGDEGLKLMVFLIVKLILQFILGAGTFFALAYWFRLKPMGECVKIGVGLMRDRFPRIAGILEKRFLIAE